MDASAWVSSATAIAVAIVAAVAAHSVQVQRQLKVYEGKLAAHAALWSKLRPLAVAVEGELDRASLATDLTNWYYSNTGGLLLSAPTQAMFVALRDCIMRSGEDVVPLPVLKVRASLLRTQLKSDIAVYVGGHVSSARVTDASHAEFVVSSVMDAAFYRDKRWSQRWWMRFRYRFGGDEPAVRARKLWLPALPKDAERDYLARRLDHPRPNPAFG